MKIKIYFFGSLLGLLCGQAARSQTTVTLLNENFETSSNSANVAGTAGTWSKSYFGTLTAYPYNEFFIQSACTANNLISGSQTLQVTGRLNSTGASCSYQNTSQTSNPGYACLVYKEIDATALNTLQLSYKWRCNGQANADYGNLMYSTDGTTWNTLGSNLQAGSNATQTVTNYVLPAALDGTIFYLGWRFISDATTTAQPGLSLDDIVLTGTAPATTTMLGTVSATQPAGPTTRSATLAILRLRLPVFGTIGTLTLNGLTVTSGNTANADVSAVKLWTGTSTSLTTQLGTTTFSGSTATFTGLSTNLTVGNNYLWVVYDVSASATLGDSLDASIAVGDLSITAAGGATNPGTVPATALDPAGKLLLDYCGTAFPSAIEPITNVTFAGINNTTAAAIGGAPGQEYFTNIAANVTQGQTYTMSVTGNTNGNFTDYIRVFADWNKDGDFNDASEAYDFGSLTNSTGTDAVVATGTITVPATALTGTTRLRIVKAYSATVNYPVPCNTAGYGQSEDYKLLVNSSNLPVTLGHFTGRAQGTSNLLLWNTLSETSNDRFEVERSADGMGFRAIGTVKGNPANQPGEYRFTDAAAEPVAYYRLKQVDVGGGFSYSPVVRLENKAVTVSGIDLYPNPAAATVTLRLNVGAATELDWTLTNLVGATLQQGQSKLTGGDNRVQISLAALPAGTYLLKGQLSDGTTLTRPFTKE